MPADPFSTLLSTSKPGVFVDAVSRRTMGRGPDNLGEQGFAPPAEPRRRCSRPRLLPAMGLLAITFGIAALAFA